MNLFFPFALCLPLASVAWSQPFGAPQECSSGPLRPVGALESILSPCHELVDSSPITAPEFGAAVALDPGDAGRAPLAYVGAPRARVDGGSRGAVQMFRAPGGGSGHWLDGWGHFLEGHGLAVGARFGASVAAAGGVLVIGAPRADGPTAERSGLVRIYAAPGTGPGIIHRPQLLAEIFPPPGFAGAAFGATLAVETSADGQIRRLAVGAPNAQGPDPSGVALAGRVFVYRMDTDGRPALDFRAMAPTPRIAATFGQSLAFAGGYLVVGAPGDGALAPGAGRVFGFASKGELAFEIAPPVGDGPGAAGVRFGSALCAVGHCRLAIASFGRGLVEVFWIGPGSPVRSLRGALRGPLRETRPIHEQTLRGVTAHRFGTSIASSGQLLLVGAPGAPQAEPAGPGPTGAGVGKVFVHARIGGIWTPVGALRSAMPTSNGEFGLAIAGAAGLCVIGEPGSHGACPEGSRCMVGLAAAYRMPR